MRFGDGCCYFMIVEREDLEEDDDVAAARGDITRCGDCCGGCW